MAAVHLANAVAATCSSVYFSGCFRHYPRGGLRVLTLAGRIRGFRMTALTSSKGATERERAAGIEITVLILSVIAVSSATV